MSKQLVSQRFMFSDSWSSLSFAPWCKYSVPLRHLLAIYYTSSLDQIQKSKNRVIENADSSTVCHKGIQRQWIAIASKYDKILRTYHYHNLAFYEHDAYLYMQMATMRNTYQCWQGQFYRISSRISSRLPDCKLFRRDGFSSNSLLETFYLSKRNRMYLNLFL